MAKYCDAVILIWNGTSNGTKHMMDMAKKYNKPYYLYKENDITSFME